MSARDEFETWRKKRVGQLERELQRLSPKAVKAPTVPRDVEESVGRALEDYLRRHHCTRGTLELTRLVEEGLARFEPLVYGLGEGGRLETFVDYPSEHFLSLAEAFLEQREHPGRFTLQVEVRSQRYTAALAHASGAGSLTALEARERLQVERRLSLLREVSPDATPYGLALARRVLQGLERGRALAHSHRDDCGMCLFPRDGGGFVYTSVVDGTYAPPLVERAFDSAEALLQWLAQQSDLSLSGYGEDTDFLNQRLNRRRLEEFAAQA